MNAFAQGFQNGVRDWLTTARYVWIGVCILPFIVGCSLMVLAAFLAFGPKGARAVMGLFE